MWFLARAKLKGGKKFYGAYLGGFPERARALLGCNINDPVLHVCGGMSRDYLYKRGFGPNDKTLDLDPACNPDFLQDARDPFPFQNITYSVDPLSSKDIVNISLHPIKHCWSGILIDPPYTEEDAAHYVPGVEKYPPPAVLVRNSFEVLPIGGRCGIIHFFPPTPPKNGMFVACVGIISGFNNRIRVYSVYERLE